MKNTLTIMKKIILSIFTVVTVFSCSQGVQVTFDDDNSNAIRAHFQNYLNNDMEGLKSLWSPDLKVYLNSKTPVGVDELVSMLEAQHAGFNPITMSFGEEGGEDLGVWVQTIDYPASNGYEASSNSQTWFTWSGKSKISGNEVVVPVFIGFQWKDGKIVQEWHHYDPTNLNAEMAMLSSE